MLLGGRDCLARGGSGRETHPRGRSTRAISASARGAASPRTHSEKVSSTVSKAAAWNGSAVASPRTKRTAGPASAASLPAHRPSDAARRRAWFSISPDRSTAAPRRSAGVGTGEQQARTGERAHCAFAEAVQRQVEACARAYFKHVAPRARQQLRAQRGQACARGAQPPRRARRAPGGAPKALASGPSFSVSYDSAYASYDAPPPPAAAGKGAHAAANDEAASALAAARPAPDAAAASAAASASLRRSGGGGGGGGSRAEEARHGCSARHMAERCCRAAQPRSRGGRGAACSWLQLCMRRGRRRAGCARRHKSLGAARLQGRPHVR